MSETNFSSKDVATVEQVVKKYNLSDEFKAAFFQDIKGKPSIKYDGLVILAKEQGIYVGNDHNIVQYPTQENGWMCIAKACFIDKDGNKHTGHGDASPDNCAKMVASAYPRMAETRAKGRALRDALGIGMLCSDELTDGSDIYNNNSSQSNKAGGDQVNRITKLRKEKNWTVNELREKVSEMFGIDSPADMTKEQAMMIIMYLEMIPKKELTPEPEAQ